MNRRDLFEVTSAGKLRFHFHKGQLQAWNALKRFILVLAGTQGGKTSFGPIWLWREMQQKGPGDYLVVAPTFPLLELKLLPEFKNLFEDLLQLGRYVGSPTRKFTLSREGALRLWGADPGTPTNVYFGHAQDPSGLESATAKAAWLDEAGQKKFKQGSFEAILRRLALHEGRVLITTTPYYHGWLKRLLHDAALKGDPDTDLIRFESRMNPLFSPAEWERAKARLPTWRFDMFYRAMFTKPAGLIYEDFDEDLHVTEPFEIPSHWPRAWGFDFGGVNTACIKFALQPGTDTLFAYEAYKAGGKTAAQHAALLTHDDQLPTWSVGGAWSEDNWRTEFTAAGLQIDRPPIRDVEVGINRVTAQLKQSERIKIFSTLELLFQELRTYSRKLDDNNNPLEAIEGKSQYHLLDGWRYIASQLEHDDQPLSAAATLSALRAGNQRQERR